MRSGQLDQIVVAQSVEPTWRDGERTDAWTDAGAFWASVREATGREQIRAGQLDAARGVVVTARFGDAGAVTPKHRIRIGGTEAEPGRVLTIQSTREIGRREAIEILCTEDADGARGGQAGGAADGGAAGEGV